MKQSRFWLLSLLLWLFFLYNIERLGEPFNIASFVYVFTIVCGVLIIIFPFFYRMPFYWPTLMAMPVYFLLKIVLGYGIGGRSLPITVTEICAIGITIFLSEQVVRRLEELRKVVSSLTIDPLFRGTHTFENGQGQIYREIRRARHYHRPAAIMAVSVTEDSLKTSLDRLVQEAQNEITKEYTFARLANLLIEELQDTDIVAQRNNHFVALLPETNRESISDIVRRIEFAAVEKLGLNLRIGTSTFPDEAVTLERLLEQAEADMKRSEPDPVSKQLEPSSASSKSVFQL